MRERQRGRDSPNREENNERQKTDVAGTGKTEKKEMARTKEDIKLLNQSSVLKVFA